MTDETKPPLSVVIRTFNSARTLPALLERLQPGSEDDILFVDSGSKDATLELVGSFPRGRTIHLEAPFHHSRALNAGFEAASQRWVVTISSHCIPLSDRFLDLWRASLSALPADIAVVFGTRHFHASEAAAGSPILFYDRSALIQPVSFFAGSSNAAYRRACWRARPFSTSIRTGEDVEWATWALGNGWRTACIPDVPVLYRNQGSLLYMFRKGWGESEVIADGQPPSAFFLPLCINLGSLTKKLLLGRMPFGVWWRQAAHSLGAIAAAALHRRRNFTTRKSSAK